MPHDSTFVLPDASVSGGGIVHEGSILESSHSALMREDFFFTITPDKTSAQQGQKIGFFITASARAPNAGAWLCNVTPYPSGSTYTQRWRADTGNHDFHFNLDPGWGTSASIENVFDITVEQAQYRVTNPFGGKPYSNTVTINITAAPTSINTNLAGYWEAQATQHGWSPGTITGNMTGLYGSAATASMYSEAADTDFGGLILNQEYNTSLPEPLDPTSPPIEDHCFLFLLHTNLPGPDVVRYKKSNDSMGPNYVLGTYDLDVDGIGGAPITCSVS